MNQNKIKECINKTSLFKALTKKEIDFLATQVLVKQVATQEVIFHENDSCNALYILVAGTASAFKSNLDHSQEILIKKFEVGDVFGEMSFLDNNPRSATIQSNGPCTMLVLQRNAFHSKDLFIIDLYAHIQANIAHS